LQHQSIALATLGCEDDYEVAAVDSETSTVATGVDD
jgi:hypothetical protein